MTARWLKQLHYSSNRFAAIADYESGDDSDDAIEGFDCKEGKWIIAGKSKKKKPSKQEPIASKNAETLKPVGTFRDGGEEQVYARLCTGGITKCGKLIKCQEACIMCDSCGAWFHADCQALCVGALDAIMTYDLPWICMACRYDLKQKRSENNMGKSIKERLDEVEKRIVEKLAEFNLKSVGALDKVAQNQKQLQDTILNQAQLSSGIKRSIDDQTQLLKKVTTDSLTQKKSFADAVKGSCEVMAAKVEAHLVEVSKGKSAPAIKDIAEVFESFQDREKRKSNIVIHNLPEQPSGSKERRTSADIGQFQMLAKDVFGLDVGVTKSFRAGAKMPDKIRLLILSLADPDMRDDIVKQAYKLRKSERWHNIYITADKSKQERDEEKRKRQTLKDELRRRTDAAEANLIIRRGRIVAVDQEQATRSPRDYTDRQTHNAQRREHVDWIGGRQIRQSRDYLCQDGSEAGISTARPSASGETGTPEAARSAVSVTYLSTPGAANVGEPATDRPAASEGADLGVSEVSSAAALCAARVHERECQPQIRLACPSQGLNASASSVEPRSGASGAHRQSYSDPQEDHYQRADRNRDHATRAEATA